MNVSGDKMKSIKGSAIVITGAAQGVGRELAILCAKEGANLALLDIDKEKLDYTTKELSTHDGKIEAYHCDISKKDDIDTVSNRIMKDFGIVDILINNAAVVTGKKIVDCSYEEIKKTLDVNLLGVIWMTKKILPQMIERNKGLIVMISSVAGHIAAPKMGDYCATKFGIIGFNDTLRMEMTKFNSKGVKVSCVFPGPINTGMFKGFKSPFWAPALDPEKLAMKVLHQSIKKEKNYVFAPPVGGIIPFIKVLPPNIVDKIFSLLGGSKTMDNFQGHG